MKLFLRQDFCILFFVLFFVSIPGFAATSMYAENESPEYNELRSKGISYTRMSVDYVQVRKWNEFTDRLYQLHLNQLHASQTKNEVSQGGYSGMDEFFTQHSFYDKRTNRLLSRVRWENENPDKLHSIEVYIYDENNKLLVDFASTYLPKFRNAPIQTLINLHSYDDELHAFRQFDASGARIYEQCKGKINGIPVFLSLEEEEIPRKEDIELKEASLRQVYNACFANISPTANGYLNPLTSASN